MIKSVIESLRDLPTDFDDALHPTQFGYQKMGIAFSAAVQAVIDGNNSSWLSVVGTYIVQLAELSIRRCVHRLDHRAASFRYIERTPLVDLFARRSGLEQTRRLRGQADSMIDHHIAAADHDIALKCGHLLWTELIGSEIVSEELA